MQASIILAYIGLVCACILIITWLTMAIVDLRSVSRVTIRLVAGIAIADVLSHTSAILTIGSGKHIGSPYCETLAAVATLDRFLYTLTNIAISYHLYRAIVQLKKPSFKAELTVWVAILAVIAVLMIIFHFVGAFSGTIGKRACNAGADDPTVTKAVYGITALLNFVTIVSGIFVTIVGHKNLGLWIESFSNKEFLDPKDQEEFKAKKYKETQRSFLYPLSAILTLSTEVVLCIWMIFSMPPPAIYIVNSTMLGFKGILTLYTFLIDPTAQIALKHTYRKLRGIHTDEALEMKDI